MKISTLKDVDRHSQNVVLVAFLVIVDAEPGRPTFLKSILTAPRYTGQRPSPYRADL